MKKTIALLGQPNSGKSTLFNGLTGSHQHVGNWPGKTVEKLEGSYTFENEEYTIVDLPGSYSLSANSEEEIITRDYIAEGNADLICLLADASQLERSLFMLTDFIGLNVPAVLILNLMDVAEGMGKKIDAKALEAKLGIPVIPFVAADKTGYPEMMKQIKSALQTRKTINPSLFENYYANATDIPFFAVKELVQEAETKFRSSFWLAVKCIENDKNILSYCEKKLSKENYSALNAIISDIRKGTLHTGNCKFAMIQDILKSAVNAPTEKSKLNKFDKIATSHIWGKPLAIGMMILAFTVAMIVAMPLMYLGSAIPAILGEPLHKLLSGIGCPTIITSLFSQIIPNILYFSISMSGFVIGVTFAFAIIEEVGYMARISFVFDSIMARLGLQGKSICSFLMSFGCTMGGTAGTRVIDNWGQRILTIALTWSVPCAATWAIMPTLAQIFFGKYALLVLICLLLFMFVAMGITALVFGNTLAPKEKRTGMIMELPPYHKPKLGNVLRTSLTKGLDIFLRALKVVSVVAIIFWLFAYSESGNIEDSAIYKIGVLIEPVTKVLGLRWQTFMAFITSAISKEAVLGVLSALYAGSGDVISSAFGAKNTAANLGEVLPLAISKPEALAFMFATTFNVPCLNALASTYRECHSLKWTVRIALYYIAMALVLSFVVYHIALLIF